MICPCTYLLQDWKLVFASLEPRHRFEYSFRMSSGPGGERSSVAAALGMIKPLQAATKT